MFESRISEEGVEKLPFLKIFVFLHGLMIWRVTQRNVWSALIHNLQKDEVEVCREQETPEAEASKSFLKGTCTESLCEYWHPPECQFYKTKSGCKFGAECSFPHWRFEEQPNRKPKKGDDKSALAIVKSVRQLSCVSPDTEPPDSATICRKGAKVLEPIRRVRFTWAALRQANIREKIKVRPLGKIQVKIPHQRSPYAVKFEDRSPGETARQERCARGDAWETCQDNP